MDKEKVNSLIFELKSAIQITRYNIDDKRYCNLLDIIVQDIEEEINK